MEFLSAVLTSAADWLESVDLQRSTCNQIGQKVYRAWSALLATLISPLATINVQCGLIQVDETCSYV